MSRKEYPTLDQADDDMPREVDFSKAVRARANTAYRFGEDRQDELHIAHFWQDLGFEVELISEPEQRRSMAPDFLLKRKGRALAICEVKSMADFDYTVAVTHEDGTITTTKHTWRESVSERMLRLANRAMEQLEYWNGDHALANIFVFVNRDSQMRWEDIQGKLCEMSVIDAVLWFEVEGGSLDAVPTVIASERGRRCLEDQMGLTLDTRLKLTPAA